MSDAGKAVFLSYASQDAEAAKHICDALRAAGVEVWFDAEGGLEHGDEWDAKIRRQIKDCVLFLPIISANTQAREEGYFRIEWELAAQRALGIASGVAFILPIVIDDTREPDALVPDRFRTVQWTRLRGGELTPEVKARFLKLWSHRTGVLKHLSEEQGARSKEKEYRGPGAAAALPKPGWKVYAGLAVAIIALVSVVGWWLLRPSPPVSGLPSAASPAAQAAMSDARSLTAKVWEQLNKPELARAQLETADGFGRRATELDPNDADAWAAWSQVDSWTVYHNFDASAARREAGRAKAARALQLAPDSYEARLAQACFLVRGQAGGDATLSFYANEAEKLLRALLQENPDEPRALLASGILYRNTGRFPECRDAFHRMARNPAFAVQAWNELGWAEYFAGDYTAAGVAIDRSIALQGFWGNLALKQILAQWWLGDLDLAKVAQDRMPVAARQEDIGIYSAVELAYWRREPETMLQILDGVPRDWLQSNGFTGPTAWYAGLAHQMAGRAAAAQLQWRTALAVVERRLGSQTDSAFLIHWKGTLLAALGKRDEAEPVLKLAGEMGAGRSGTSDDFVAWVLMGNLDRAIDALERRVDERRKSVSAAAFRLDPDLDPLRPLPRFQALLARMEADPRFSPQARSPEMAETKVGGSSFAKATEDVSGKAAPPDAKSVAVLAFANLSDDKANEYFSDGISEELLNVLAKIPGLKVSARTSAFYFKGKEVPIPEIAQKLGVAYVVEGSVRKQGSQVRITAQLIKAADGFHVWSDTFTRDMEDIFAVQDEIAGKIATSLMDKLGVTVPTLAKTTPEAYTLYLQARATLAKRGVENLRESVRQFEAVVALDPNYLPARSGLARALSLIPSWTRSIALGANQEGLARATQGARLVIEREPDNAEAWSALGYIIGLYDWHWREAGEAVARSLALAPNDAEIVNFAGDYYRFTLDFQKVIETEKRAVELNPLQAINHMDVAYAYLALGQYERAIAPARTAISLAPDLIDSYDALVRAFGQLKRFDEMHAAIAAARQVAAANPAVLLNMDILAAMFEGRTGAALRLLEEFRPQVEQGGYSPTEYGYHYLLLGQPEKALYWLRLGCQGHDAILVSGETTDLTVIAANPVTRTVLDDPGLKELLEIRARNAAQKP